jgi:lia operon protein LiaG
MKNIKYIVLILVLIAIISITASAMLLFVSNGYDINAEEYQVSENKTIDSANVNSINIEVVSSDIEIVESLSENIEIYLTGQTTSKINERPELKVTQEDDIVTIAVEYKTLRGTFFNFGGMHDINLKVALPKNIVDMKINTISGDLDVSNFEFADFKFEGVSADANINNIKTNNFQFSAISGDLTASNLETSAFVTETTSGNVKVSSLTATSTITNSISGDVNLDYTELEGGINVESVSGDIKFKLPSDSSFAIDFDTSSGDLTNQFTGMTTESIVMVNGGLHRMYVSTVSGDLSVSK